MTRVVALEVFTAAPVPEPATWVLLIGRLPILAFLRGRRREGAMTESGALKQPANKSAA
jgi:hypothetical protein